VLLENFVERNKIVNNFDIQKEENFYKFMLNEVSFRVKNVAHVIQVILIN